jgi:uncharacterized protein involved in exopolysaccharide biosynthesis/Mrp family chromosome partitioning ATPase
MELVAFLKMLRRHRTILILVPLVTMIVSYIVVSNMPDRYVSHSSLATGLADKSRQLNGSEASQESKVNQEFGNIIQTLTLNKLLDQVSYSLLLHDLEKPQPYRKLTGKVTSLSPEDRTQLITTLREKQTNKEALSLWKPSEQKINKILQSMKYDSKSLSKKLKIFRVENSDFVNLEFESDNPHLSASVLNVLSDEFIQYYSKAVSENKQRTALFLDSVLRKKQAALIASMEELRNYKIDNGLVNLEEQSRSLYTQMTDIATRRGLAQKDIVAYNAALRGIDNHFDPKNRRYIEGNVSDLNQDIVRNKEMLQNLNDAYLKSDFDPKYKIQIDSLQKKISGQIYEQTDRYAYNPLAAKENLVNQKINIEVSRDLAKNSVASLNNEIGRINEGLNKIGPGIANLQAYEAKVELANKEYAEALERYNNASLEANYALPVKQVEKAMPENAQPSKKPLLVLLSGIASLILCLTVLFGMFYFDRSVYTASQLEAASGLPILGSLNQVHPGKLDLQLMWNEHNKEKDKQLFKSLLRSLRHEISQCQKHSKIIAVTSLDHGAGKTFVTTSLAYAFTRLNKRVLIIDGNFTHPDISNSIQKPQYLESFLLGNDQSTVDNMPISILGNKGGDYSLLELGSEQTLMHIFSRLSEMYDIILIETSTMDNENIASVKEWIMFADKVIAVHAAGQSINNDINPEIKYLQTLGEKFYGFILNKMPMAQVNTSLAFGSNGLTSRIKAIRKIGINLSKQKKLKPIA